ETERRVLECQDAKEVGIQRLNDAACLLGRPLEERCDVAGRSTGERILREMPRPEVKRSLHLHHFGAVIRQRLSICASELDEDAAARTQVADGSAKGIEILTGQP